MSVSKEKKINKLKNRAIWPFVVAIVMVVVLFLALSAALIAIAYSSIFSSKIQNLYDTAQEVAQNYEENGENKENFEKICNNMVTYTPNLLNVCVVDQNNQLLWNYADSIPDFDAMSRNFSVKAAIDQSAEGNGTEMEFLFNEDENENDLIQDSQDDSGAGKVFLSAKLWGILPVMNGTEKICVQQSLVVYHHEVLMIVAALGIFAVLAILVLAWNIVSLVRMVRLRKREKDLLYIDVSTGGNNLQYFYDKAEALLKANQRTNFHYALLSIRMEKYHNFCSCYGIKEAEELMENLDEKLQENLQSKELVSHAAKADFAALLKYGEKDNLFFRLDHLLDDLKKVRENQKLNFGIGIYWVPEKYEDIATMYNYAELAQETIPEDLEDHIKCFEEEMLNDQRWVRKVEDEMEHALSNREFKVYLQPKYSTKEERLSGAEALVRWIHPKEGFIPPNKFIPIFEQNGFILQLDDYMLNEIAKMQAKWLYEGKEIVPISVNVSRAHFTKDDLAEHICKVVDKYNVPHDKIELELTESAFFDDKDILINTVKKLKQYGFEISMDDFGAGYSSLNSLKELPLDVLKLDAEFFRGEDREGRGDLIVGEAITLAKKLDMRIVAEGIETREQVDSLAEKNCDLIQGYYFAKPMPIEEFEKVAFGEPAHA